MENSLQNSWDAWPANQISPNTGSYIITKGPTPVTQTPAQTRTCGCTGCCNLPVTTLPMPIADSQSVPITTLPAPLPEAPITTLPAPLSEMPVTTLPAPIPDYYPNNDIWGRNGEVSIACTWPQQIMASGSYTGPTPVNPVGRPPAETPVQPRAVEAPATRAATALPSANVYTPAATLPAYIPPVTTLPGQTAIRPGAATVCPCDNPAATAAYLQTQLGNMLRAEFLVGDRLAERVGILVDVGATYMVLEAIDGTSLMLCDLCNLRFATIVSTAAV